MMLAAFLLQACEKEVTLSPWDKELDAYVAESRNLPMVSTDSITHFVYKLNTFVLEWPDVKNEERYDVIIGNVQRSLSAQQFSIKINPEWNDTLYFIY